MRNRMYAIKNHKVLAIIDTAPYSEFAMEKLCKEIGASDWFELDEKGALELMQVQKAEAQLSDNKNLIQDCSPDLEEYLCSQLGSYQKAKKEIARWKQS